MGVYLINIPRYRDTLELHGTWIRRGSEQPDNPGIAQRRWLALSRTWALNAG